MNCLNNSWKDVGMTDWQGIVRLADTVSKVFISRIEAGIEKADYEGALQWGAAAAGFVVHGGGFRRLAWPELESRAVEIGRRLFPPVNDAVRKVRGRVLHVITEAYELFGHTKLCRKWISSDRGTRIHDVVLLAQRGPIARNLKETVELNGGRVYSLKGYGPLVQRARELRRLAIENAETVILHIHPNDLIATAAFATPGGPPVVLVNHADHVFWVGATVADIVFDIRESGQLWTLRNRGGNKSKILPIPIEETDPSMHLPEGQRDKLRSEMRRELGIPDEAVVFLTIGAPRKYAPMGKISFPDVAVRILKECENAWVVVIGPELQGPWLSASRRIGNRLMALGTQTGLGRFHAMADIYLEGMPVGSLTALLEAGLNRLPCVRAPLPQEPPYCADGAGLEGLLQPQSLDAYVSEAVGLAHYPETRIARAMMLEKQIRAVHCRTGWLESLQGALFDVPQTHAVQQHLPARALDGDLQDYWMAYMLDNDPIKAKAKVLIIALDQTIRCVGESRRFLERRLPEILADQKSVGSQERRLVSLLFPELHEMADEILGVSDSFIDLRRVAKNIMTDAIDEGRRFDVLILWLRMLAKRMDLLGSLEVWGGILKAIPGAVVLAQKFRNWRSA
jgi:hypothetical protein